MILKSPTFTACIKVVLNTSFTMANQKKIKGVIGILTGGGDVPGLNPAIRAVTIRANREGYKVIGLRRGWGGILEIIRDPKADNSQCFQVLTDDMVNRAGRTGGTFLHTSRKAEPCGKELRPRTS